MGVGQSCTVAVGNLPIVVSTTGPAKERPSSSKNRISSYSRREFFLPGMPSRVAGVLPMPKKSMVWFSKEMFTRRFAKDLYHEIQEDNIPNGAAALAFYLMLAFFPALIFLLTLLPYLPIANLTQAVMDFFAQVFPGDALNLIKSVIQDVTSQKHGGLLSFGLLFTLWSASSGITAIIQQLNITYDVTEGRSFWRVRGTALLLTILFIFLVVGAFTLIVTGGIIQNWLAGYFGRNPVMLTLFSAFRWIIILLMLLLSFSFIYYFSPDVEQEFRFVTPGSIFGVVILALATLAFRLYVSKFANYNATYGSIGAVIILLMWLYITGLVILFGSEINALIEHYHPEGKEKGEKREGEKEGARQKESPRWIDNQRECPNC